jgi:hypothetical protein
MEAKLSVDTFRLHEDADVLEADFALRGVRFSSGWIPEFLPMPSTVISIGFGDLKKSFNLGLRPVFEENGATWGRLRWFGG